MSVNPFTASTLSPGGNQTEQVKKGLEAAARARARAIANAGGLNPPSQEQALVSVSVAPEGSKLAPPGFTPSKALQAGIRSEAGEGAETGDNSPIYVKSSEQKIQGINTVERNALISATGREFGPDIALKVRPKIVGNEISGKEAAGEKIEGIINKIINKESSITEVLNILAFLLNNDEERNGSVITEFSYEHVNGIFEKLYASFKDKDPPPFDIKTLTLTLTPSESSASVASAETKSTVSITIPGTILKRDERCELKNDIILNSEQIQPLISACILQMVNILENTRQVFGGWAKLFKGMQGGSNSKSKTKTRRNNRRRH